MNMFSIWAGVIFGAWPLIMKKSGLTPMAAAFVLTLMSFVAYVPFLSRADYRTTGVLTVGFGLAALAGVMNGMGTIFFQKMVADKSIDITVGYLLVILTQIVVVSVGAWLFYGDVFTWKKVAGLFTAALAAYLLTSK